MTTEDKRHVLTDMCQGFKKCGECNIGRAGLLYKQAGNSIVVDALVGIFKNLFRED